MANSIFDPGTQSTNQGFSQPTFNHTPYTPTFMGGGPNLLANYTPPGGGGGVPGTTSATTPGAPPANPYDQSVSSSGYNPYQYATSATSQNLAQQFGGQMGQTQGAGPNAPPPQNVLDFGGGYTPNAGLMQHTIDIFGMDQAKRMFADEARIASTGTDSFKTNPSFAGYDPRVVPQQNPANASFGTPSPMATPPTALTSANPQQFTPPPQTQIQPQAQGQQRQQSQQQQNPLQSLMMPFLLNALMGGMGGQQQQQPQAQQSNPFSSMGNGFGTGNGLSGVAQLLSFISMLQQPQQQFTQPAATPNTGLYFPMFG